MDNCHFFQNNKKVPAPVRNRGTEAMNKKQRRMRLQLLRRIRIIIIRRRNIVIDGILTLPLPLEAVLLYLCQAQHGLRSSRIRRYCGRRSNGIDDDGNESATTVEDTRVVRVLKVAMEGKTSSSSCDSQRLQMPTPNGWKRRRRRRRRRHSRRSHYYLRSHWRV